MASTITATPKFKHPPVTETLLGVQFAPLRSFSLPHFGLYWGQIRSEYPVQDTKPPLGPQLEEFGPALPPQVVKLMLSAAIEARCWFIDSSGSQLIQVQRDRFIRNWRKATAQERYPEYEYLRPRFEKDWGRFCSFLADAGIERPEVNQCEVTYINHIPLGEGFSSFGEIHRVVTLVAPPPAGFLPSEPEVVVLNNSYLMPDKKGRLHVTLQPAVRKDDNRVVLQLTLTARGRPEPGTEGILRWFDIGHEWITRGFADLTTAEMHRLWGRER